MSKKTTSPPSKKRISVEKAISLLPTTKEAETYSGSGYFGYDHFSSYQEQAFVTGVEWAIDEFKRKIATMYEQRR